MLVTETKKIGFHNGPMKSLVCVNANKQGEICGVIYNNHLKQPIVFTDVLSMLNKMDSLFNQTNCPQVYHQYRSFAEQQVEEELEIVNGVEPKMDEIIENKAGEKATFIVQVQFRQNSSWQGTITWTEKKKTLRYRSTLEMLKLIDSAVSAENGDEKVQGWDKQN